MAEWKRTQSTVGGCGGTGREIRGDNQIKMGQEEAKHVLAAATRAKTDAFRDVEESTGW